MRLRLSLLALLAACSGGSTPTPAPAAPPIPYCTFVVAGQSLAANFNGPMVYTFNNKAHVFQLYYAAGSHVVAATDPLTMDSSYSGDSTFISPFIDQMVGQYCVNVVAIPLAVGGTYASQWAPGGNLNPLLAQAASVAQANGLTITAWIWRQGEEEALLSTTTEANYLPTIKQVFASMQAAAQAPVFVWVESWINGFQAGSAAVSASQQQVVDNVTIFQGPNSDLNGCAYRIPAGDPNYAPGCVHDNPAGILLDAQNMATAMRAYFATYGGQ